MDAWEAASARDGGGGSSSSSTGGAPTAEIFEDQAAGEGDGEGEGEGEGKVFVAVPEQHKSGRSLLAWALRHVAAVAGAAVVVAHVHAPAQMIPMSTCSRSASSLLATHRTLTVGSGWRAEERGTLTLAFPCIARLAFWFVYLPEPQMRRSRRRRGAKQGGGGSHRRAHLGFPCAGARGSTYPIGLY